MKNRLVIHIGSPKTGSSFIQNCLEDNRDILRNLGFDFPSCFSSELYLGQRNHVPVATFGLLVPKTSADLRFTGPNGDEPIGLNLILRDLLGVSNVPDIKSWIDKVNYYKNLFEAAVSCSTQKNFIISSEALFHSYQTDREWCGLIDYFRRFFLEIDVIVYLRRQIDYAASQWSQCLREGAASPCFPAPDIFESHYLSIDYYQKIKMLQKCADAVIVRPFSAKQWHHNNIFFDFLWHGKIDSLSSLGSFTLSPRSNETFDPFYLPVILELLHEYPCFDHSGEPSPQRKLIRSVIDHLPRTDNRQSLYTRDQFRSYSACFDESNFALLDELRAKSLDCLIHAENSFDGVFHGEQA